MWLPKSACGEESAALKASTLEVYRFTHKNPLVLCKGAVKEVNRDWELLNH